jgi:hypothetical protein
VLFPASKIHENFCGGGDQGEQLSFRSNFKIETDFELQIQKNLKFKFDFNFKLHQTF